MMCPTSQELESFLAGQLAESRFEQIAEHLEDCQSCGDKLEQLEPSDTLDEQIRNNHSEEYSWAESLGARQLTQRLLDRNSLPDDQLGPDAIGRIKIVRYLASGSFGRVFIGWDEELERHVAVKLPRVGMYLDDESREQIRREARQAARVEHPGIVPIYDIGTNEKGDVYIISGFVDGCDLKQWRETESPSIEDSVQMVQKIAEIIAFAHKHQLVHRDIKPGNILIDKDGNPHLVDFGLSTTCGRPNERSTQGLVGTPAYLPPDYLDYIHPPVDPRGDLYSLGVVLFELLTGFRPYVLEPATWHQTLRHSEPIKARTLNHRIPRRLERICQKAINRNPTKRFQTAEAFSQVLGDYLSKSDSSTKQALDVSRISPIWMRRLSAAAIILFVGVIAWAAASYSATTQNQFPRMFSFTEAPTSREVNLTPVPVEITSQPDGALIAIVPLSSGDWSPREDALIRPESTTPVELKLIPGDYLIEVVVPGHGFHQVIRQVKSLKIQDAEKVALAPIKIIHQDSINDDLALVRGGEFPFGLIRRNELSQRLEKIGNHSQSIPDSRPLRSVDDFLIQTHEPTYADYQSTMGSLTPAMKQGLKSRDQSDLNRPAGYLTFPEALEFAEAQGLRLLTEVEWEYVASNQGTTRYPWGNDFPNVNHWDEISKIDLTISDQHPPVHGMYSGSMEWVATSNPQLTAQQELSRLRNFLVKGGFFALKRGFSLEEVLRRPEKRILEYGVTWRDASETQTTYPRLGVRFGRDVGPRYLKSIDLTAN